MQKNLSLSSVRIVGTAGNGVQPVESAEISYSKSGNEHGSNEFS
jgi:hypothetical protein